ncbi:exodeoxyribonuclease V, gamma subunit [Mycobacterium xenopi 4042]|uniref:Exodeoxyribonuclease V, gamma subunit n=1 Tax=Mycobacterium xenopi 4042 TaxID=1299334 RepID=X8CA60_MYCXE|nr:exodeoxyribonuclease V, gamma subunit [Mycobacterium xenopi 4042]
MPPRLSLFGHTRLASTEVELLDALATHHDLHLWLPHPSDDLWRALSGVHGTVPRAEDTSRHCANHTLLETLGRDLRELQRALPADPASDEFLGGASKPETLLGWLQSDIAANAIRPEGGSRRARPLGAGARLSRPARQVDVLREVLLGLLDDDPTLEPRDIVVMCPDIETYAPLIVASFGLGETAADSHPAHRLRVKLADRALNQTNPLLAVAAALLAIAGPAPPPARCSTWRRLRRCGPVPVQRRRPRRDHRLGAQCQYPLGFDQCHRRPYGLGDIVHNTWRFGLDRILTGVAMSDDSRAWLGTALPLDDVGSDRVELAGRLAEYVDQLHDVVEKLSGAKPLTQWLEALSEGVGMLTEPQDAWQQAQLQREFTKVLAQAGSRESTVLRLPDVRSLLDTQLAGRPTRANFRTGMLTVCTMVPMRSVPHRVVCLVGLDDGVFPRLLAPDGDDVLARCPMTGERDVRSEDRQLLLDAICAATETLVITYTGADEHSGHERPPAVPLAELLDALDQTTQAPVREHVVTKHPLQPFDRRNVTPGELVPGTPFTFDPTALTAAQAAAGKRCPPRRFIGDVLPAPPPGDIALADLLEFFKDPVKGFFRRWITRCRGTSTRSRTRCRSRSAPCRSGSSATACCTTCCAASTPAPRPNSSGGAAHCRRAAGLAQSQEDSRSRRQACRGHPAGTPRRAARPRRGRRPRRWPEPHRHGHTGFRRPHRGGDLFEAGRQASAAMLAAAACAGRRRAEPRVDGDVHRATRHGHRPG